MTLLILMISCSDTSQKKDELELQNKDGIVNTFFDDGQLESQFLYDKNLKVGDGYIYNPNGSLNEFHFYDLRENLRYKLLLDQDEKILEEEGKPFYTQVVGDNKVNYVGDTISIVPMVGNPFKEGYRVKFYNLSKSDKPSHIYDSSNKTPLLNFSPKESGKNDILLIAEIIRNKEVFRRDSIILEFQFSDKKIPKP